jgi:hypothetical protein
MTHRLDITHFAAALLAATATALLLRSGIARVPASTTPPGRSKSAKTRVLETGAAMLQPMAPLRAFDVYLVGFHPMKDDPHHQMEAHHFCRQVNEDFMQCVLFDGNTADANLTGIEYIVSERLFERLPQEERRYWHPHNGEILSGQLVAPGLPEIAETALMRSKMNSYGKTWHLWDTGGPGREGTELPMGDPKLAWSFNRDGEANPCLLQARDTRLGVNTTLRRRAREALVNIAHPQEGVDALKGRFDPGTTDIPGVRDKASASTES